jgi:hypothetical protein
VKFSDKIKSVITETGKAIDFLKEQSKIQHPGTPVSELFDKVHASSPVFVLSTGRTGTQFLTELLRHSSLVRAHHEPEPTLNLLARKAWQKEGSDDFFKGCFEGARYELLRNSFILNKGYVETNNRITFLAPFIRSLYPNAKFVHLVREAESFVKSGLQRGWYTDTNIHDEGRITKQEGWGEMDQVDRIAWLWAETNRWITQFGKIMAADKWYVHKSEDLYRDDSKTQHLLHFCGADDISSLTIKKYQRKPVNTSKGKKTELTREQRNTIYEITADAEKTIYGQ